MTMTAAIDEQGLKVLTSPSRLRQIDQLREKNIGQYLPLPQLVVVGDQSSGKSSLLETLTGIPFPRGLELCTRYATQITHSRDDIQDIRITVLPHKAASSEEKNIMDGYSHTVKSTTQLFEEFPAILEKVNKIMGIKSKQNPDGTTVFAEHVLKIEKRGPQEDYLTIIDVPGLFSNAGEGTTTDDAALVQRLVEGYVDNQETIILAVLDSRVDIANQGVLQLAKRYDPDGTRTLGVLTKADALKETAPRTVVCQLINNEKWKLKLGYYLIRNRGADDFGLDTSTVEQREKETFQQAPWSTLPKSRVGVAALRKSLQVLLSEITDKAFPTIRKTIHSQLADALKDRDALGSSRETEREQQQYLVAAAGSFGQMVDAALFVDYSSCEEVDQNELRLITAIVNLTETFNSDFMAYSHKRCFEDGDNEESGGQLKSKSSDDNSNESGSSIPAVTPLDDEGPNLATHFELDGIINLDYMRETPEGNIMDWIEMTYYRSRGVELGTFGPGLLSSAFRKQSEKWESMTRLYMSKIILNVHAFIVKTLRKTCPDEIVFKELRSSIMNELLLRYKEGMDQALYLVKVERAKRPYTLNHYFSDNLQKSRGIRIAETLRLRARPEASESKDKTGLVVDLESIQSAVNAKTYAEHVKEDIHDILKAYYKIACERFVDNVYQQAVDYTLLSGPRSPLKVFTGKWVLDLKKEDLKKYCWRIKHNHK